MNTERLAGLLPIPMLLWCPKCNEQHIDEPSEGWDNPPHRSHLCHACGCIWRPADVATTGVADVKTAGDADTWGWTGGDSLLPSLGKRLAALEEALKAAHFYIDASDREIADLGITRDQALYRARQLDEAARATLAQAVAGEGRDDGR